MLNLKVVVKDECEKKTAKDQEAERKKIRCQKVDIARKRRNLTPRHINISERNFKKNFRELVRRDYRQASLKTSTMEIDMGKQGNSSRRFPNSERDSNLKRIC